MLDTGSGVKIIIEQPCDCEDAEQSKIRIKGVADSTVLQQGCKPTAFELQARDGRWVKFYSDSVEYVRAEHHQVLIGLPQLSKMRAIVDCHSELAFVPSKDGSHFDEFAIRCKARYQCKCMGENGERTVHEASAQMTKPTAADKELCADSDPASRFVIKRFAGCAYIPRPTAVLRCNRGLLSDSRWSQVVEDDANAAERDKQAKEYSVKLAMIDEMRADIRRENRKTGWKRARRIKAEVMIAIAKAAERKQTLCTGADAMTVVSTNEAPAADGVASQESKQKRLAAKVAKQKAKKLAVKEGKKRAAESDSDAEEEKKEPTKSYALRSLRRALHREKEQKVVAELSSLTSSAQNRLEIQLTPLHGQEKQQQRQKLLRQERAFLEQKKKELLRAARDEYEREVATTLGAFAAKEIEEQVRHMVEEAERTDDSTCLLQHCLSVRTRPGRLLGRDTKDRRRELHNTLFALEKEANAAIHFGVWAAEVGLEELTKEDMECVQNLGLKMIEATRDAVLKRKSRRGNFEKVCASTLEMGENFVDVVKQQAVSAYLENEAIKELIHKPRVVDSMEDQTDRTCQEHLKTTECDLDEFVERSEKAAEFENSGVGDILRRLHIAFTREKSEVLDEIKLELVDKTPVNLRPFPCTNPVKREQMRQILNRMIAEGKISKSTSDYCSPAFVIPKKNGTGRLLLDCRELNKRLRNNAFPIPRIQGLIDKMALHGAVVKSTLDFSDFFFQHPLHKESRRLLAFDAGIGAGLMELNALAQGLVVSPAFAQEKLQSLLDIDGVAVYVDDIIIFTRTVEEHRKVLSEVLKRIGDAGYKLNHVKCEFFRREVTWLGMRIGEGVIKPDEAYMHKLNDLKQQFADLTKPRNQKDVKRVLGLLAFYARFCSNFAKRAEPIVKLTRKGTTDSWGREQANALKEIVDEIADAALTLPDYEAMMHPDPTKRRPLVLCCDASDVGIGAWLAQRNEQGTLMTIAFESKTFAQEQRNWDTCNREYFAFVWSVNKFRTYLEGAFFEAFTDNAALVPILARKHFESPKQARWALRLQEFDFRLRHLPGANNMVADALSRDALAPLVEVPPEEDVKKAEVDCADESNSLASIMREVAEARAAPSDAEENKVRECELNDAVDTALGPFDHKYLLLSTLKLHSLRSAVSRVQAECEDVRELWKYRNNLDNLPDDNPFYEIRNKLEFWEPSRVVFTSNGFLIPQDAELKVLRAHHGDVVSHVSIQGMRKSMRHLYFHDKDKKIVEFVGGCPACAQHHRKPLPPPRSHYPDGRGDCIAMDLLELRWRNTFNPALEGQFEELKGGLFVLVCVDVATKWPSISVLTNKDAPTVANAFLNDVIPITGPPLRIISDLGSEFVSNVGKLLYKTLSIEHHLISKGNKGGNGIVENMNAQVRKRLERLIRRFPNTWRWKTGFVVHDLRTTAMPSRANLTPAELMLGFQPRTLWGANWQRDTPANVPREHRKWYADIAETVNFLLSKAQSSAADHAAERRLESIVRGARDVAFEKGDRVWAQTEEGRKDKRLDNPRHQLATVVEPLDPRRDANRSLRLIFDREKGVVRRIPLEFVTKLSPEMLRRLTPLPVSRNGQSHAGAKPVPGAPAQKNLKMVPPAPPVQSEVPGSIPGKVRFFPLAGDGFPHRGGTGSPCVSRPHLSHSPCKRSLRVRKGRAL